MGSAYFWSLKWLNVNVSYLDFKEAAFHSSSRGCDLPLYYMDAGQGQQVKLKALNAVARGMQRASRERSEHIRECCKILCTTRPR